MFSMRDSNMRAQHRSFGFHARLLVFAAAAHAAPFTVIVLPDTQHDSEYYPEIYDAQTQ
jgi:hypothetical protein